MVNTPPFQKKGENVGISCLSMTVTTQCAACASLSQEQWSQLRETFAKRSTYRNRSNSQDMQEETTEPVFSGPDYTHVDDSILDLPEHTSGIDEPVTGIHPLHSSLVTHL